MCFADGGKNAYGWINDLSQSLHFIRLRNAGFKNTKCMFIVHLPNTQGYANL